MRRLWNLNVRFRSGPEDDRLEFRSETASDILNTWVLPSISQTCVGLEDVSLSLALALDDWGYDVVGIDVDDEKIDRLRSGEFTVNDVTDAEVTQTSKTA